MYNNFMMFNRKSFRGLEIFSILLVGVFILMVGRFTALRVVYASGHREVTSQNKDDIKKRFKHIFIKNKIIFEYNTVLKNHDIPGDLIIVAQNVNLEALRIKGNLIVLGQNIKVVDLIVGADVVIIGGNVDIKQLKTRLNTLIVAGNTIAEVLGPNVHIFAKRVNTWVNATELEVRATIVQLRGKTVYSKIYLPDNGQIDIDELNSLKETRIYYGKMLAGVAPMVGVEQNISFYKDIKRTLWWIVLWWLNSTIAAWLLIYLLKSSNIEGIFTFSKRRSKWMSDTLVALFSTLIYFSLVTFLLAVGAFLKFGVQWLPLSLFLIGLGILFLVPAMIPINLVYAIVRIEYIRNIRFFKSFVRLSLYYKVFIVALLLAVLIKVPYIGLPLYIWFYFATLGELLRWGWARLLNR